MTTGEKGLFRQSFFSCLKISQFISLYFKFHRYFYSGSENNKLESGEIRVNMLTRRLPFPCIDYVQSCVNILFLHQETMVPVIWKPIFRSGNRH